MSGLAPQEGGTGLQPPANINTAAERSKTLDSLGSITPDVDTPGGRTPSIRTPKHYSCKNALYISHNSDQSRIKMASHYVPREKIKFLPFTKNVKAKAEEERLKVEIKKSVDSVDWNKAERSIVFIELNLGSSGGELTLSPALLQWILKTLPKAHIHLFSPGTAIGTGPGQINLGPIHSILTGNATRITFCGMGIIDNLPLHLKASRIGSEPPVVTWGQWVCQETNAWLFWASCQRLGAPLPNRARIHPYAPAPTSPSAAPVPEMPLVSSGIAGPLAETVVSRGQNLHRPAGSSPTSP